MRVVRTVAAAALLCAGLAACSSAGAAGGSGSGSGSGTSAPGQIAASSRDVSFTVDGTKTYGTLEIPAHRSGQQLAAALLLAGSGPTDRDGNQPSANVTPQTLKLVAGVLAQQGIETFRFDKYFSGQTGGGKFASDPGAIDLNAYIRQADYAYDYLIAQPGVDRQRGLVVGHSEGGFYAMLVADTVSTHPAGLALLEPQDQRILSLVAMQLDEQLNAAVQQGRLSAADARQQAAGINNAITQFRAGQPVDTSGLLPQIAQQLTPELLTPANAKVARTDDEVNPVDAAAKVPSGTRVLVTDGTADTNIPVSTINPLAQALTSAGTSGPGLKVLTGIDHDLHTSGTPGNDAVLAPSVVAALKAWAQPYAPAG
jgi:alpha-beta hydrolase superfamily lysophospholipase